MLRSLTIRKNLPGLVHSLGVLLFYCLTTGLSLYFYREGMWIPMVGACIFHGLFSNFLGMEAAVHELSHKTPFKSRWLNELFYGIFAFLTWNNPVHFRESHKKHHQVTLHRGLDKEAVLVPGKPGPADYLSWLFFDWKKFKMIMGANIAFVLGKDQPDVFSWDPLFKRDDPGRKRMILWARFQMASHLLLVVLFAVNGLWVLIYTVTFSYFFFTVISRFCEISQHSGMPSDVPDWRLTCHTMKFNPVISFFYWNMNYHTEHHMYAAVPFYNLSALHRLIRHDTPQPVRGYLGGVRKIVSILKKQRDNPGWYYEPELP